MPIKITNEGWVKVPAPKVIRKPKPVDPVDVFRGPLAYITGRPEFKEPVKKPQTLKQLMIEAASMPAPPPPPEQLFFEDKPLRSHRSRRRIESASASLQSQTKLPRRIEEVDEEIPRPDLYAEETQSRRSASPIGSRHGRVGPSSRSKRHASQPNLTLNEEHEDHRHSRRGQHSSSKHYSSRSVYYDDDGDNYDNRPHQRSSRSDRSYRDRDQYYPRPHPQQYSYPAHASTPTLQPIIIYSNPPPTGGCGTHHHGCSNYHSHACAPPPRPMIEPVPVQERIPEVRPKPAPSVAPSDFSSSSSRSRQSTSTRSMSYKWYSATQPLNL